MIALMAGPIGFMIVIFAVLVVIKGFQDRQQQTTRADPISRTGDSPTIVTVDRRIIYQVPTVCPECGGSLSNEEVDWVGPLQAKCPYCRTTIEAQPAEF